MARLPASPSGLRLETRSDPVSGCSAAARTGTCEQRRGLCKMFSSLLMESPTEGWSPSLYRRPSACQHLPLRGILVIQRLLETQAVLGTSSLLMSRSKHVHALIHYIVKARTTSLVALLSIQRSFSQAFGCVDMLAQWTLGVNRGSHLSGR